MLHFVFVRKKKTNEKAIPLKNGLPAWEGNDVAFVCQYLEKIEGKAGSAAEITRSLGFEDRRVGGGPSNEYLRICDALRRASAAGHIIKAKKSWTLRKNVVEYGT